MTFDPLPPDDRGFLSATRLMLLLSDEPIFPSVLVGVLPLLLSDARSSSECWEIPSTVSDILYRSATERWYPKRNKKKTTQHNPLRRGETEQMSLPSSAEECACESGERCVLGGCARAKKSRGSAFCLQITSNTAMPPRSTQHGSKIW